MFCNSWLGIFRYISNDGNYFIIYKDAKIEELNARLNRAVVSSGSKGDTESSKQNVAVLTKAIQERDEQIDKLQDELKDAAKELEASAVLIEEMKGTKKDGVDPMQKSLMNLRSQLYEAQQKIKELKVWTKSLKKV